MDKQVHPNASEHEKCQCITFDEKGSVVGSCDTLFAASRLTANGMKRRFPFLENIISYFREKKNSTDPLFVPQVEFECDGYYSVCDFTFMPSIDAHGVKRFIWMIYDNSIHYRDVISSHFAMPVTAGKKAIS